MKKIMFINDIPFSFAFGGKEVQLLSYFQIAKQGLNSHDVKLLDPWHRHYEQSNFQTIYHFFGLGLSAFDIQKKIHNNASNSKFIISPNFYTKHSLLYYLLVKVSLFFQIKNIFSIKYFILQSSNIIVVNSHCERDQIIKIFDVNKNKFKIVHNFIPDSFNLLSKKKLFTNKYGINPGYFLTVSFVDERKNIINLIKAHLNTFNSHKKILVIIGDSRFSNKTNNDNFLGLISKNMDKIRLIKGLSPNSDLIKSAYFNCHAHVLPSYVETPGISNIEALSFNKKIIVGDCPPVREYFKDSAIYTKFSIGAIEKALLSCIKLQSKKKIVNQKYLQSKIRSKILSIYKSL
jgi:glycosyltransferase involved in cell wall biosynthesis